MQVRHLVLDVALGRVHPWRRLEDHVALNSARWPILPGNGWVTAQRRQPPPFSSRCAGDARTRPPSLSVESSESCSDRQTRRSAERASAEVREGAMCVQRLDDSLNSAIRTTYRSSLRSSSKHEPRGPPLEVVFCFHNSSPQFFSNSKLKQKRQCATRLSSSAKPPRRTRRQPLRREKHATSSLRQPTLLQVHKTRCRTHGDVPSI